MYPQPENNSEFKPVARNFSVPPAHLLCAQRIAEIQAWAKDFSSPLTIEIGCGVGLHPIKFAKANPTQPILAIERTTDKFIRFQRRVNNHGLANLFPVHTEAAILLPHLLKPRSVGKYYVLYPNPYPKKKQKNLRWAHSKFLGFMVDTLKEDGKIIFRTNLAAYAKELVEVIPRLYPQMIVCQNILGPDHVPETHFEKKYLLRQEVCTQISFTRRL